MFLVVAPGVAAGLVPWLLTGWSSSDPPLPVAVVGAVLVVAGAGVLLHAFGRFVVEGRGTPAPVAPAERLVVGGLVRGYEEPTLSTRYGEQYAEYRRAVPAWWPRIKAWS